MFCVLQGARIVRVHNVRETVDAMRMIEAIVGWREPAFLKHNMPTANEDDERAPSTASELLEAYAIADRATPRVRMNFVMSLDGAVTLEGRSGGLGDESDRLAMQVLRTLADVVLVGAGTVRVEGYGGLRVDEADAAWRRSHGLSRSPGRGGLVAARPRPGASVLRATPSMRPIVVTHAAAPADRREALAEVADVLVCGDDAVDLRAMLGGARRRAACRRCSARAARTCSARSSRPTSSTSCASA